MPSVLGLKAYPGPREVSQKLRASTVLAEDLSLILSTYLSMQPPITPASDASGLCGYPHSCAHTLTNIHIKIIEINLNNLFSSHFYVYECFYCMCVCISCAGKCPQRPEEGGSSLGLELQMV